MENEKEKKWITRVGKGYISKINAQSGGVGPSKRTNFLPFTRDYRGMAKHTPLQQSLEHSEFDSCRYSFCTFFFLLSTHFNAVIYM